MSVRYFEESSAASTTASLLILGLHSRRKLLRVAEELIRRIWAPRLHGDLVSRQRKGLLRPTVRLDGGLFSRESVASVIHVRRPCKARRSGYVAMSPCHAARAVAARLKSIVRFGALAG